MKKKFVIFCNRTIGELKREFTPQDVVANMSKRHKQFWSNFMYKDEQDRTINITKEFLEQGMTMDEVIADWIEYAEDSQLEEPIYFLQGTRDVETL